jgi:ribonucleoside-diphosphate reductase subunit M1
VPLFVCVSPCSTILTQLAFAFSIYRSNFRHRPIGIGVQGLADAFQMLRIPFDSPEAKQLNKDIFETIYFGALTASCDLAEVEGHYETYPGSPVSEGKLQYDLWGVEPSNMWDWASLKAKIAQHGIRNSLLVAPMPTASTAQILGNNESTEPFTSNMYNRRVLAGEFTVVNKHLLRELTAAGIWTDSVRNRIIAENGSVQNVPEIPKEIRDIFKTVWEISQRSILDMAADRAPFICQSQSLNVHIADPDSKKLTSMHFYAWSKGLKTGMYYLRTRPKADAIKFTVDTEALVAEKMKETQITDTNKENTVASPPPVGGIAAAVGTKGLTTQDDDDECLNCGA